MPLLALTPVLLVPVEWLLLGDVPDARGLGGIVLVVAGVYILNTTPEGDGWLAPFRAVVRDEGSRRMLAVATIWAVSAVVDKMAVTRASTAAYGTGLTGLLALGFLPIVARKGSGFSELWKPGARGALMVQGLLFGLTFALQMEAIQRALTAYVITIKRSGALVTVLLGALCFGERRVGRRMVGTAVAVAGVLLVATA